MVLPGMVKAPRERSLRREISRSFYAPRGWQVTTLEKPWEERIYPAAKTLSCYYTSQWDVVSVMLNLWYRSAIDQNRRCRPVVMYSCHEHYLLYPKLQLRKKKLGRYGYVQHLAFITTSKVKLPVIPKVCHEFCLSHNWTK